MIKLIKKPWGKEVLFAVTDKYVGKILCINKGARLSLQFHQFKDETMYVVLGSAKLTYNNKNRIISVGDSVRIKPGAIHRLEALKDTQIIEVSTPELDDVIRLEDDYNREIISKGESK